MVTGGDGVVTGRVSGVQCAGLGHHKSELRVER